MSIQPPLLLASASGLLPEPLGTIAGTLPFGDIPSFLMLLAVVPSIVMSVILVLYQLRRSRIDDAPGDDTPGDDALGDDAPGSAAKPPAEAAPENPTRLMRDAIEQLNGIAAALHDAIPKAERALGQKASDATASAEGIAKRLDTLDDTVSRTDPLPLASEAAHNLAQLAAKVCKLTELTSRMQDEGQALKRDTVDSQLASEETAPNRHYLTFTLGEEQFALSIENIQGVVEAAQLVAEPSMPPKIRKAIRLQGGLVPVIDLGARFGGRPIELGRNSRIVILEVPSGNRVQLIGAVVDSVGDVLELPPMQIKSPAASSSRIRAPFTQRTLMLDDRAVTVLGISRESSTNELALYPTRQENHPV